jgi:hypothetical protein
LDIQSHFCSKKGRGFAIVAFFLVALAGMRFVNDNVKVASAMLASDLYKHERKLLHGADNNLFARFDKLAEITSVLGMSIP